MNDYVDKVFPVCRNGKWIEVDVSRLTDDELRRLWTVAWDVNDGNRLRGLRAERWARELT